MNISNIMDNPAAYAGRQLRNGKSGAEVWEVEDRYILKKVRKEQLPDPAAYTLYRNEAYFYRFFGRSSGEMTLACLPEVLDIRISEEEIGILMKKYREPSREKMDEPLLRKILGALALVHSAGIPDFLKRGQKEPEYLGREQIETCVSGWRAVLAEHPGAFDEAILTETAGRINEIIGWHHAEEQILSHGDFHWDNLLQGDDGAILICDWQGVNMGGASGDISFFLSRLGADGTSLEPKQVVELYCRERFLLTGETVPGEELLTHMQAANTITSFQFWHHYLHGSDRGRVGGIYEKMAFR